jgi:hypothetical protein
MVPLSVEEWSNIEVRGDVTLYGDEFCPVESLDILLGVGEQR